MKLLLVVLMLTSVVYGADKFGNLTKDDQKYYKNDSMDGLNQRERMDSAVMELNKVRGDMASMKAEIQELRKEVDELKKGK